MMNEDVFVFPVAPSQQRMWFLDQFQPGNPAFNNAMCLRLRGPLDPSRLGQALRGLLERHEALRTWFGVVESELVQVVAAQIALPLEHRDLSGAPDEQRDLLLQEEQRASAVAPFELSRGPLCRFVLYRRSEQDHELLVVLHHIISDGWSFAVFFQELSVLYTSALGGGPGLPELPLQYADFSVWQRDEALQGQFDDQIAWWKERLVGLEPLEFPTDLPRPPVQGYKGVNHQFRIEAELVVRLKQLASREGATLFMVLFAAFGVLLHRCSGQLDFGIGFPVAGRGRSELEGLIGFFINTLVLRVDFSGNPTLIELLRRVREASLDAISRQDVPFDRIVEAVRPKRDMSRPPLFQALFLFQNTPSLAMTWPGLSAEVREVLAGTAQLDMTLSLSEQAGALEGFFNLNSELFSAETGARMARQFATLLAAVAATPEQLITRLSLLPQSERQLLVSDWNATATTVPQVCIHELFEAQAARVPESIAIQSAGQLVSYRNLEERSNRLAHFLRARGVGPNVPVALFLERSLSLAVGMLGVLKAGGAYLPLDPSYPKDRLAFMLQDSAAPLLLTQESLINQVPESSAQIVCLDRGWKEIAEQDSSRLEGLHREGLLAYLLYTSGSTGRPKGVMIEHHSVVNFLSSMAKMPGLTENDVLYSVTSPSFDIFGLELFLPLMVGARVAFASRLQVVDGSLLLDALARSRATVLQATPSMFRLILGAGELPPAVRVFCGGEALPAPLAERLCEGGREVWNLYGPTETTIWSTMHRVQPGQQVLVGRPIANTQTYVLDALLQPTPVGVPGELYIGGEGVARGYLNRPDLTRERFIEDPFRGTADARMYRTGDRVRWKPNGQLEFLGRIDNQIKLRGYRIELGEIEAALLTHPEVKVAAVIVREDAPGQVRLVGYVVANSGAGVPFLELRNHLKRLLPEYMLPSAFVFMDALPLTPNGKLDRKALPIPERMAISRDVFAMHDLNPIQRSIAAIWAELLQIDSFSVSDNFFDLGGNSVLLVHMLAELLQTFGVEIPIQVAFSDPSLGGLGDAIENMLREETPASTPASIRIPLRG